jgi:hypothetical protein
MSLLGTTTLQVAAKVTLQDIGNANPRQESKER